MLNMFHVFKYKPKCKNVNNIVKWKLIDKSMLIKSNQNIIQKHKNDLCQSNHDVIIYCIKYNIKINYIVNDITILPEYILLACEYNNVHFIKNINSYINVKYFLTERHINRAFAYNSMSLIKYLHKEYKLDKRIFTKHYNFPANVVCRCGYFGLVKYLHKKLNFDKYDFIKCMIISTPLSNACENNHVNIIKYLHNKLHLIKSDLVENNKCCCCILACANGSFEVVKYLVEHLNYDKEDFTRQTIWYVNKSAFEMACYCGYVNIVNYLIQNVNINIPNGYSVIEYVKDYHTLDM